VSDEDGAPLGESFRARPRADVVGVGNAGTGPGATPPPAPPPSAPTSDTPPLGTQAPGPSSTEPGRRQPRSRKRRVVVIAALSVLGVVILIAATSAAFLWYENTRIHRVHVKHLATVATSGPERDVQNILLIGSTTRCGLKQQNPAFGLCSEGVTGVNSDVVMILHLDPDHNRAAILSIPRDTFVPNARHDGVNKIDAALGDPDGPGQLIAAITEDFGIPIQHYVELNFDSFQGVVDALGGVKMYFPMPVHDQQSTLDVAKAGCTSLNGFQALAVVRARHLQYQPTDDTRLSSYDWPYDPQSDLSRIRRDHEFLRVLGSAVAKRGLGNVVTDAELIDSVAGNLEVDSEFSASLMAHLVLEFHSLSPFSVPQYTLPVVEYGQSYFYRGSGYGDVVFPVQPDDSQVIAQFLGTTPTQDAAGGALPSPGSFTMAVENGSGIYNQGSKTAAALESLGFHVVLVTDTQATSSPSEATVLYSNAGQIGEALRVQSVLSGLSVLGYDPGLAQGSTSASTVRGADAPTTSSSIDVGSPLSPSQSADIVLVTGTNFAVSAPTSGTAPVSTPTSTTPPTSESNQSPTTTTSGPLAGNPNLAAPSGATEPLEPWDPRSCTPLGGEGP
jgi:LCP family protein required for cell wall assembly